MYSLAGFIRGTGLVVKQFCCNKALIEPTYFLRFKRIENVKMMTLVILLNEAVAYCVMSTGRVKKEPYGCRCCKRKSVYF